VKAPQRPLSWLGLQSHPPRTGLGYVGVRVLVYVVALVLTVVVYGTKERGLLIAPPVALFAAAGTWYFLGDTAADGRRRVVLSAGVALVMAELTWAFGYWDVPPLVGAAGLWLGFYVLSGVVEHAASLSLDRRIAAEYAAVAGFGTLVISIVARPWSI